ncbi:amidohydrolase family protein [Streptomyces macrosporus]|uniref:Amidohydrolase-related domain-containing protein n=1 Tax=Streptomyces macrosporus TaxID=44032 RepID=A0ABN3KBM6_9ACTN
MRLITGTDVGSSRAVCDDSVSSREFFHHLGHSPTEIVDPATHETAQALGIAHDTGLLRPGHHADLLSVADTPLDDLQALRRMRLVMTDGVPPPPQDLTLPFVNLPTASSRIGGGRRSAGGPAGAGVGVHGVRAPSWLSFGWWLVGRTIPAGAGPTAARAAWTAAKARTSRVAGVVAAATERSARSGTSGCGTAYSYRPTWIRPAG